MIKIFRNFRPFWKMIVVIVLLLVVQAYCDLSMPAYTAGIIDVGITNSGVEHILPEKIKADEFKAAELFMSDSEKTSWENSYKEDGDVYVLTVTDKDKLNKLDDQLLTPIVLTYQLGHMTESTFKETLKNAFGQNPAYAAYASKIDDMSLDQISQIMGLNQSITQIITSVATIIGVIIMMLSISPLITLIALVILPVSAGLLSLLIKFSQKYFRTQQNYLGHINGLVEETFGGQMVIKAFNKEEDTIKTFDDTNGVLYDSAWRRPKLPSRVIFLPTS
jgi:ABC-type multidrug transport system, ATPase and permease components